MRQYHKEQHTCTAIEHLRLEQATRFHLIDQQVNIPGIDLRPTGNYLAEGRHGLVFCEYCINCQVGARSMHGRLPGVGSLISTEPVLRNRRYANER